jgi:hypothetical protein
VGFTEPHGPIRAHLRKLQKIKNFKNFKKPFGTKRKVVGKGRLFFTKRFSF